MWQRRPSAAKNKQVKKKDCHACGTSGPHENCAHLHVSLGALRCVPMSVRCLPPQGAGVGPTWHLGSGADHEDAQTNEDHAGGHSTDEDLEGHHHLLRLPAGSWLVPCEAGGAPTLSIQLRASWWKGPRGPTPTLSRNLDLFSGQISLTREEGSVREQADRGGVQRELWMRGVEVSEGV